MASDEPLTIDTLHIPGVSGRVGMLACPGIQRGPFLRAFEEPAYLRGDLIDVRNWGADILVSLVQRTELELLRLDRLPVVAEELGLIWYHMPIPDFQAPDPVFEERWRDKGDVIRECLVHGGAVALHCLAGMGRTGTVAARLLIEFGIEPEAAIRRVREARPGTIQSVDQELYLLQRQWER